MYAIRSYYDGEDLVRFGIAVIEDQFARGGLGIPVEHGHRAAHFGNTKSGNYALVTVVITSYSIHYTKLYEVRADENTTVS